MKYTQSGLPLSCGDVVLEYVGDHLTAEVVGCSSLQTIDVVFDLPLVTGSFPGEGSTSPRAMIQLSRASGTNHYVDQGSTSYGNRFENKGARLTVTRGPRTSAVDLAINLSGTVDVNAGACSQCTVGGPQITLDLDLALTNIPKP